MLQKTQEPLWKRRYNFILVFLFILVIGGCATFFIGGWQCTHDLTFHANRFHDLVYSIRSGTVFPYMGLSMFYEQGYPAPTFYPYLFLYPFALLPLVGISPEFSFGLFYVLLRPAAVMAAYVAAHKICAEFTESEQEVKGISVLLAVLYALDPYQAYNYFVRGAVGELLAAIWIPIAFAGFYLILKEKPSGMRFLIVGMTGLFYSHCISVLLTGLIFLCICFLKVQTIWKHKRILLKYLYCAGITAGLSIPYLGPMLKMLFSDTFLLGNNSILYRPLEQTVLFSMRCPTVLGLILCLLLCAYMMLCKRLSHRWIQLFLLVVWISTDIFPWKLINAVPFLNSIQFAWRIYLFFPTIFGCLIIKTILTINKERKKSVFTMILMCCVVICMIASVITFKFCQNQGRERAEQVIDRDSIGAWDYLTMKSIQEFNQKTLQLSEHELPDHLDGCALNEGVQISKTLVRNRYEITYRSARAGEDIRLPILYYDGYAAKDQNGERITLRCSPTGLISFTPTTESGTITVYYRGTLIHIVSFCIFGITLLWCFVVNPVFKGGKILKRGEDCHDKM